MKFDPAQVRLGTELHNRLSRNPEYIKVSNQASEGNQNTVTLDAQNNRMAGYMGARALELMNNPIEAERTFAWEEKFLHENEYGVPWLQAKMGLM